MDGDLTIGHGSTLNPHGIEFSAVNRDAPGYAEMVERLRVEGDPLYEDEPKPVLIALSSRAMQSGKSTLANRLVQQHGFALLKFAGPLKAMTRTLLAELGEDTTIIERRVEGDLKEVEIPALKRSCRYVMQRLGTEFGRELLHENVWAEVTVERAKKILASGKSVVIDDMRYLNELAYVRDAGGIAVRVVRPGATVTGGMHSSEGELDDVPMVQFMNAFGGVGVLHQFIDDIWVKRMDDWRFVDSLNKGETG